MRYAVISPQDVIINVVEWDGTTPWTPPAGCQALPAPTGEIGWTWNKGSPINPNPPPVIVPVTPPVLTVDQKLAPLGLSVAMLAAAVKAVP